MNEDIFKINQKEDENMEDCVEFFQYTLQISAHADLDKNILKIILIRGMIDESFNMLNLMEK
jgi:hypothetical protein